MQQASLYPNHRNTTPNLHQQYQSSSGYVFLRSPYMVQTSANEHSVEPDHTYHSRQRSRNGFFQMPDKAGHGSVSSHRQTQKDPSTRSINANRQRSWHAPRMEPRAAHPRRYFASRTDPRVQLHQPTPAQAVYAHMLVSNSAPQNLEIPHIIQTRLASEYWLAEQYMSMNRKFPPVQQQRLIPVEACVYNVIPHTYWQPRVKARPRTEPSHRRRRHEPIHGRWVDSELRTVYAPPALSGPGPVGPPPPPPVTSYSVIPEDRSISQEPVEEQLPETIQAHFAELTTRLNGIRNRTRLSEWAAQLRSKIQHPSRPKKSSSPELKVDREQKEQPEELWRILSTPDIQAHAPREDACGAWTGTTKLECAAQDSQGYGITRRGVRFRYKPGPDLVPASHRIEASLRSPVETLRRNLNEYKEMRVDEALTHLKERTRKPKLAEDEGQVVETRKEEDGPPTPFASFAQTQSVMFYVGEDDEEIWVEVSERGEEEVPVGINPLGSEFSPHLVNWEEYVTPLLKQLWGGKLERMETVSVSSRRDIARKTN